MGVDTGADIPRGGEDSNFGHVSDVRTKTEQARAIEGRSYCCIDTPRQKQQHTDFPRRGTPLSTQPYTINSLSIRKVHIPPSSKSTNSNITPLQWHSTAPPNPSLSPPSHSPNSPPPPSSPHTSRTPKAPPVPPAAHQLKPGHRPVTRAVSATRTGAQ